MKKWCCVSPIFPPLKSINLQYDVIWRHLLSRKKLPNDQSNHLPNDWLLSLCWLFGDSSIYIHEGRKLPKNTDICISIMVCKESFFLPRKFCKSVVFEFHYLHSVWFLVLYKSYHTLKWRKQFLRTYHKVNIGRQKQLKRMSIESSYHCFLCVQNDFAYYQYFFSKTK